MQARKARILLIDDDEGIRRALSTVLEDAGHLVDTAKDGGDAMQRASTSTYDLALIDIRLPDMDGTKLLSKLQSTPRMVKIIVTGYPTLQNAVQAVKKGADGYITKPVDMERLLDTISYHLKQRKAQEVTVESRRPRKAERGSR